MKKKLLVTAWVLFFAQSSHATTKELSVDERLRLVQGLQECLLRSREIFVTDDTSGGAAVKLDSFFKKFLSTDLSANGQQISAIHIKEEFAAAVSNEAALMTISACFQGTFGEPLVHQPIKAGPSSETESPPKTEQATSSPTPKRKASLSKPRPTPTRMNTGSSSQLPPMWACRKLEVFTSATCDTGKPNMPRAKEVVRNWQVQNKGSAVICNHDDSSWGNAFVANAICEASGTTLRLSLENRLEGQGGHAQSCTSTDRISTRLAYRTNAGGAVLNITSANAGRYDLHVIEYVCTDSRGEKVPTHLTATYQGKEQVLSPDMRIRLHRPGNLELRFLGEAEMVSDGPERVEAHGECTATLSLQLLPFDQPSMEFATSQ